MDTKERKCVQYKLKPCFESRFLCHYFRLFFKHHETAIKTSMNRILITTSIRRHILSFHIGRGRRTTKSNWRSLPRNECCKIHSISDLQLLWIFNESDFARVFRLFLIENSDNYVSQQIDWLVCWNRNSGYFRRNYFVKLCNGNPNYKLTMWLTWFEMKKSEFTQKKEKKKPKLKNIKWVLYQ